MRKVLLVYPKFPPSFWGFQYAMEIIGKKSNMPPLGLITVAGMFPGEGYELNLVDMNVSPLEDYHIAWADIVLTSTMIVQQESLRDVIARCNLMGVRNVAGGPYPTSYHDEIEGVDCFILGEGEEIVPQFIKDLESGNVKKMYRAINNPDVGISPTPRFDLLDLKAYRSMASQFSRGCPFDCEFCEITNLYGRVPRTKSNEQMLAEFDFLYSLGWCEPIFIVDDNFIGNRHRAESLLHAIKNWQKEKEYPFSLFTEASVTLAELESMMKAMVDANLTMVFLGLESPNPDVLKKLNKKHNTKKGVDNYLLHAVNTIQGKGIEVAGGFILGLDGDGKDVFDAQINFIEAAGIPVALVSLLSAVRGTNLYQRLKREGRLLMECKGNNTDIIFNFVPELDKQTLINGYKRILTTLYDPTLSNYFQRCFTQFKNLKPIKHTKMRIGNTELLAIVGSLKHQLFSKQGLSYLKFLLRTLFHFPKVLPNAIRMAILGYHLQKHAEQTLCNHKNLIEC